MVRLMVRIGLGLESYFGLGRGSIYKNCGG